jgi:hypothetical protein
MVFDVMLTRSVPKTLEVNCLKFFFERLFDGFEDFVGVFLAFKDGVSLHLLVGLLEVHFHDGIEEVRVLLTSTTMLAMAPYTSLKSCFIFITKGLKSSIKTFECGSRVIGITIHVYTLGLRQ